MPVSLIPSFLVFCFLNAITPGPANLCSLSSAMRYGRKRALIQWRGLFTGFFIDSMGAVLITYFLGNIMGSAVRYLSYIGAAYIIWLAIHILRDDGTSAESADRGCNFMTGLLVNMVNVKVILYCLTALSTFVLLYTHSFLSLLAVGLFLPFTGPLCNLVWLFAGDKLRVLFERHRKPLNILMAASLIYCAITIVR